MTLEVFAANFVDALRFEVLIVWADMLKIDHFDIMGDRLDDELPDQEDKLRGAIAEAILKVGSKTKPFDGRQNNPLPLGDK